MNAQKIPAYTVGRDSEFQCMEKTQYPLAQVSALYNVKKTGFLATLWKALIRQSLFYPLASLDVFGQWPVFV